MTRDPKKDVPAAIVMNREKPTFSDVILPQNNNALAKAFDTPGDLIALVTGVLTQDRKSILKTIGGTLQALLIGQTEAYFGSRIQELIDEEKIPKDFTKHEEGMWSFVEIFKVVDGGDQPSKKKLEALIALFYGVNKMNSTDIGREVNYRYLKIALSLKSSEIQLLAVIRKQFVNSKFGTTTSMTLQDWALKTARDYSTEYPLDLVLVDQKALMDRGLLSPYRDATVTEERQNVLALNARLTPLGIAFCNNLETCLREAQSEARA